MEASYFKNCIVPQCSNTNIKTPSKLFIRVPVSDKMRRMWLKLARREDAHCLSTTSRMYFCEDHFDLPNDMLNYTEYHIMGKVSYVRMKPGCLPSKFGSQENKKRRTCTSAEHPYIIKKQRMTTMAKCFQESSTPSTYNELQESCEPSDSIKLEEGFTQSTSLVQQPRTSSADNVKPKMEQPSLRDSAKRIVWVDLEMTGLDINKDHILEIACLVTDADLNIVAMGPNLVIHQPDSILNNMNSWCIAQHGESGLTAASRNSKISLNEAEKQILDFVSSHVPKNKCPLGGNSVYMDRLFIGKYMPDLNSYLHYRIIDVSSIKELAKRWYQKEYSSVPQKKFQHRSIDDILESVEELKFYRSHIFKS